MINALGAEFRRYKTLAEGAIQQLTEEQLAVAGSANGNSIATLCWHVSGNLSSRFTDFLTTDGEKPWREREEEFAARHVSRDALLAKWEAGWTVLLDTLSTLSDSDLTRTVTIRGTPMSVQVALLRALAHVSYHVGQVVFLAKAMAGDGWKYLSIPPGQSDAYNKAPKFERAEEYVAAMQKGPPAS
jgi:uncharacterized damage-inducible protein DinB